MSKIGAVASEFFSVGDIFQVNYFIIEKLFYLCILYSVINLIVLWPLRLISQRFIFLSRIRDSVSEFLLAIMGDNTWAGFIFFVAFFLLLASLRSGTTGAGFFIELLPLMIWTFLITKYLLYLHNIYEFDGPKFYMLLAFNPFILAFDMGQTWERYDQTSDVKLVSVLYDNGTCAERRVLRITGNGIIFYNDYAKNYEFRRFERLQGLFPGKTCT